MPHTIHTLGLSQFHYPDTKVYQYVKTLNLLRFSFVPNYHVSRASSAILSEPSNPRCIRIASRLRARPRKGLWIYPTCHLLSAKPVLRHWCVRRMRSALVEELQKRGFDKDGNRVGNGTERGAGKKNGLCGTLEMNAFPIVAVAEGEEVWRQVGLMVETMEKMCEIWTEGHKEEQGEPSHRSNTVNTRTDRERVRREIGEEERFYDELKSHETTFKPDAIYKQNIGRFR